VTKNYFTIRLQKVDRLCQIKEKNSRTSSIDLCSESINYNKKQKPSGFSKNCPEGPASSTGPMNTAF